MNTLTSLAVRAGQIIGSAEKQPRRWLSLRLALVVLLASSALTLVGISVLSSAGSSTLSQPPASRAASGKPQWLKDVPQQNPESLPPSLVVTVTNTDDHDDGTCDGSDCTLREAINATNANSGSDRIEFAGGLTGTIDLQSALPTITDGLELHGPGAASLTVHRNTAAGFFRIFDVNASMDVEIFGISITNGMPLKDPDTVADGGGVYNEGNGSLFLKNVAVTNNQGGNGAGVASKIGGPIIIEDSRITNNLAYGNGGGINNQNPAGHVAIFNSIIAGNSTFHNVGQTGGGIENDGGAVTIDRSTITDNRANVAGGGIMNAVGIGNIAGTLTITNSTIDGNVVGNPLNPSLLLRGGGIFNSANCVARVINSTISNNQTNAGGGIANSGLLEITSSTIAKNGAINGGGINNADGTVNIRSNIIALNTVTASLNSNAPGGSGPNMFGPINSQGHNVIGNAAGFVMTPSAGDQLNVTADQLNLGALDNYGGPTQTHALFIPSVAIDAGDDCVADAAHCGDPNLPQLLTDQRGTLFPRKEGDHVDAGAFELQPPPPTPTATPTATPTPAATPTATPCAGSNQLKDSSLEASSGNGPITNSNWESTSTKFGSSLCSAAVCGNGSNGQAVPRTGTFWAWFGGAEGPEFGTLKQTVMIPSGSPARLSYYLKVSRVHAHGDVLKVKIDDSHTIDTVVEPAVEDKTYALRTLDLTNFADGALHTIVFEFSAPNLGRSSSFNVDDITLGIPCPDASPTPTPTPGPTPTCTSGNKFADTSLEASKGDSFPITNPNWDSTSSHFISSLCSPEVCGSGPNGQAAPRTGKYWAWFGGSETPENGTLQQRVIIPAGAGVFLGYYLKVSKVYAPFNDRLAVIVDGEILQTIIEPATDETDYSFRGVPLPAVYADGGAHTILFQFTALDSGRASSFNIDDITLDVTCPSASPGETESVQFSGANYVVREGSGLADITVTRTGDSANSVSVNFSTNDDAGAQPCSARTGVASARCDYTQTSGTLKFAPGETSKTIAVPISDDAYIEGNEHFGVTLTSAAGATLGTQASTTVTIADNQAAGAANPLDNLNPQFFVRQHYLDFLNREPDADGWDFWIKQITSCGSAASCVEQKRVNVSAAYFLAIEFQQTGYLVERMYKAAYGNLPNAPVPIKFGEFLSDTRNLGDDLVVGTTGWEGVLENNKQRFANQFVQRARFSSAYPISMTPAKFVDQLNANAGNLLSASDRAAAIALFGNASDTSNVTARAQALRQVAENPNLYKAEFNRAFVLMQYFGYLRRDPNSGPDTDFGGYNFWLSKLNQFGGDYIKSEMVKAFIDSAEYRARFGP